MPIVLPWGSDAERARAQRIAAARSARTIVPRRMRSTSSRGLSPARTRGGRASTPASRISPRRSARPRSASTAARIPRSPASTARRARRNVGAAGRGAAGRRSAARRSREGCSTPSCCASRCRSSSLRLWWRGRREPGYREAHRRSASASTTAIAGRASDLDPRGVGRRSARRRAAGARARGSAFRTTRILMTCTTAAGRETHQAGLRRIGASPPSCPTTIPRRCKRFLEHFRPRLGVLMETEIWPNLLARCAARRRAGVLANARMSEKSARGYRRWRALSAAGVRSLARGVRAERGRRRAPARAGRAPRRGHRQPQVRRRRPTPRKLAAGRAWRSAARRGRCCCSPARARARRSCC